MSNFDYKSYWDMNYASNGNSGSGSYGALGDFKANVVKNLIEKYNITSTLDFGCGDGNMVRLIDYKNYIGLDISSHAVSRCKNMFANDDTKSFYVYDPTTYSSNSYKADMCTCLDVLYHITNKDDFHSTLDAIFSSASKLVVLYTILAHEYRLTECSTIVTQDIYSEIDKYKEFKLVDTIRHNLDSGASFLVLEKIANS